MPNFVFPFFCLFSWLLVSRQHHMTTVTSITTLIRAVLLILPFTGMPLQARSRGTNVPHLHQDAILQKGRKKTTAKNWWTVVLRVIIPLHCEVSNHFLVALASASFFSISSLITIGATCFVSVAATSVSAPPSPCLVDYAVRLWLWPCVPLQRTPSLPPRSLLISLVQIGTN